MNFDLFFKIILSITTCYTLLMVVASLVGYYRYNISPEASKLRMLHTLRGETVKGYYFTRNVTLFTISSVALYCMYV